MTYDDLASEDKEKHDEIYALLGLDPRQHTEYDVLLIITRKIVALEGTLG